ncbi:MAG TPA: AAA family ATPase [Bryobacteraceae bacterium]|nr:AAA family ATPase [Bryobacteraceae bacterium]
MREVIPDLENKTKKPAPEPIELALPIGRAAEKPGPAPNVQEKAGPEDRIDLDHPSNYLPDDGLVNAIRAALLLRRPLLLTGEPGTGKTQAAHYLNWKMGYGGQALRFDAKSTSTARDLFYSFNTIGRFFAAQTGKGSQEGVDYIRYSALGEAILRANRLDTVIRKEPRVEIRNLIPATFGHRGTPVQSVVLIDEIDKAPRDFPNDLLGEIEHMRFRITEIDNVEVTAATAFKPVTVITSNSERNLPAAFLRRCVYYHIRKPDKSTFALIVKAQLGWAPGSALTNDALDFLVYLREKVRDLQKKPATAELLEWLLLLEAHGAKPDQRFKDIRVVVESTLGVLIKDEGRDVKALLKLWLDS